MATKKTAMLTIITDKGVKERAARVIQANGMTLIGAVRLMCSEGLARQELPFIVTREPSRAGIGMSEARAIEVGINRDGTDGGIGERDDVCLKLAPEEKQKVALLAKTLRTSPSNLVGMFLGQIAFELRIPFGR